MSSDSAHITEAITTQSSTYMQGLSLPEDKSQKENISLSDKLQSQATCISLNKYVSTTINENGDVGEAMGSLLLTPDSQNGHSMLTNGIKANLLCQPVRINNGTRDEDNVFPIEGKYSCADDEQSNGFDLETKLNLENDRKICSLSNSTETFYSKTVHKARKSFSTKQTSRKSGSKALPVNLSLGLRQIEASLGLKDQSLAELDARTLDKLIFDRAVNKAKNKKNNLHQPRIDEKQGINFLKQKLGEDSTVIPDGSSTNIDNLTPAIENIEKPVKSKNKTLKSTVRRKHIRGIIRASRPRTKRMRRILKLEKQNKLEKNVHEDHLIVNHEDHSVERTEQLIPQDGEEIIDELPQLNGVFKATNNKRVSSKHKLCKGLKSTSKVVNINNKHVNTRVKNKQGTDLLNYFSVDHNTHKDISTEASTAIPQSFPTEQDSVNKKYVCSDLEGKEHKTDDLNVCMDKSIDDISESMSTDGTVELEIELSSPQKPKLNQKRKRRPPWNKGLSGYKKRRLKPLKSERRHVSKSLYHFAIYKIYENRMLNILYSVMHSSIINTEYSIHCRKKGKTCNN